MATMLGKIFKQKIELLFEDEFEAFVSEFFLIYFGPNDFVPTRAKKDKGSDGNITSINTIVASYGPSKRTLAKFKSKVSDDFKKYKDNWSASYRGWYFVHNAENGPDEISYINGLGGTNTLMGSDQLVAMFEEMPNFKQRKIGEHLNIDSDFFSKNYFEQIIKDVFNISENSVDLIPYESPLYIEDKIKINFSDSQIDEIKEQYGLSLEIFNFVKEVLETYSSNGDLSKLKNQILSDIGTISGDLFFRINTLAKNYSKLFNYSEDYAFYVKAVIIYFFEQCLIGKKSDKENQ